MRSIRRPAEEGKLVVPGKKLKQPIQAVPAGEASPAGEGAYAPAKIEKAVLAQVKAFCQRHNREVQEVLSQAALAYLSEHE